MQPRSHESSEPQFLRTVHRLQKAIVAVGTIGTALVFLLGTGFGIWETYNRVGEVSKSIGRLERNLDDNTADMEQTLIEAMDFNAERLRYYDAHHALPEAEEPLRVQEMRAKVQLRRLQQARKSREGDS